MLSSWFSLFDKQLIAMKKALFSKSTKGMSALRTDQIYYLGDFFCAMTSDDISKLAVGEFKKYWYDIEVLDK